MTMVRTSETRFAEFAEFEDMEDDNPMWRISPERMKMRSEHLVPLPRQAVSLYRSEEHTSELQSLMRISYAVFCLKKKKNTTQTPSHKQMSTCSQHHKTTN